MTPPDRAPVRARVWLVGFLAVASRLAATPAGSATPTLPAYLPLSSNLPLEVVDAEWLDADRNRSLPVRLEFPRHGAGPFPAIVLSPEIGGGRSSYPYLGKAWASQGYLVVHLQHPGSDGSRFQRHPGEPPPDFPAIIQSILQDKQIMLTRAVDVYFAFDQIERLNRTDPLLKGRIDLHAMAVAGHGLGAWTALRAAGLGVRGADGGVTSLPDPRIKALLLMTGPGVKDYPGLSFAGIQVPCLEIVAGNAEAHRSVFTEVGAADQLRVRMQIGDGRSFMGRPPNQAGAEHDPTVQQAAKLASTAFWDSYLGHQDAAHKWLVQGGLAAALGHDGILDLKLAP
jgi:dienelactone hydrolase